MGYIDTKKGHIHPMLNNESHIETRIKEEAASIFIVTASL